MCKSIVTTVMAGVITLTGATLFLAGCGGSKNQTTDEFLDSLPTEKRPGDIDVGTMPPVGESIDQVARIRLETDEFDMGVIAHDNLAHDRIQVFNDGDMPLKITRIDTTCACTQGTVTPESSLIQAGGSSYIDVVVDPRRIPGFHSHKVLTITSTDVEHPMVEVGVTATVDPEYDIGPDEIDMGDIPKGETTEKRIRFRTLIDTPVEILEFKPRTSEVLASLKPDVTAAVEEVPEDQWQTPGRREYDLVVTFLPDVPVGPFIRYLSMSTNIRGGANKHQLEFKGTIVAPYDADPHLPAHAESNAVELEKAYRARITFTATSPITIGTLSPEQLSVEAVASAGPTPEVAYVDITYTGKPSSTKVLYKTAGVEVIVDGKTYLERVGIFINPERDGLADATPPPHDHDHDH